MTDRCREQRTAALRRLIEDAEASGISECGVEEVFAEARALSDEARRQRDPLVDGCGKVRAPSVRKGQKPTCPLWGLSE